MFGFENCSKMYESGGEVRRILLGATLTFGAEERIAVLAPGGAGKTTLVRLLAGLDMPTSGRVRRPPGTSWPVGFAGAFHPALTGEENVRILATMLEADPDHASAFVALTSDLGEDYANRVESYSSGMRGRLAFAFSMAVPQRFYLADETMEAGDGAFRIKAARMLARRLENAGLFLVTRNWRTAERHADRFAVLYRHRLVACSTIDQARELLVSQSDGEDPLETLAAGLRQP